MKKILLSTILLLSTPIFAQENQLKSPTNATSIKFGDWMKVCQKQRCTLLQIGKDNQENPTAGVNFGRYPQNPDIYILGLTTPLGTNLRKGYRLLVDGKKLAEAGFEVCLADGCHTSFSIQKKQLGYFKSGKKMTINIFTITGNSVDVNFSLIGFTKGIESL